MQIFLGLSFPFLFLILSLVNLYFAIVNACPLNLELIDAFYTSSGLMSIKWVPRYASFSADTWEWSDSFWIVYTKFSKKVFTSAYILC